MPPPPLRLLPELGLGSRPSSGVSASSDLVRRLSAWGLSPCGVHGLSTSCCGLDRDGRRSKFAPLSASCCPVLSPCGVDGRPPSRPAGLGRDGQRSKSAPLIGSCWGVRGVWPVEFSILLCCGVRGLAGLAPPPLWPDEFSMAPLCRCLGRDG